MKNPELKFFSDPRVLSHVGRPLLTKLFERFNHLLPYKHFLPNPCADNDAYFDSLADVLERTNELPAALAQALREIESLAEPNNGVEHGDAPPLSHAIQSWLDANSAQSGHPESSIQHPESASPSSSAHPASSIEIPESPAAQAPPTVAPSSVSAHPASSIQNPESESPSPSSDQAAFSRLAQLSTTEYDRVRRAEAKRLHLRLAILDAEVARCRAQMTDDAQANAVKFPVIEPWPSPVLDAPELLEEVAARFTHHIILPPGAADAIALFIGHAHAFTAFYQTPRLNLYSPRRGCGKTTTLDVLATMVPRPFRTENLRAPVLFRVVDQQQPTLLLDEVDT